MAGQRGTSLSSVPGQMPPAGEAVEVACSARLHMGFLDLSATHGRRFGSIGMALDAPQTRLTLARAEATWVSGPDRERATRYLRILLDDLGVAGDHGLVIDSSIPQHAGLGSGTQLALGLAAAIRTLHARPADPAHDARLLRRGARSGVGLHLFQHGGLVVDGGSWDNSVPPLLARLAVPDDWRILLVRDATCTGLSGSHEAAAFAVLPPLSEQLTGRICRVVLMQALPALAEDDLPGFGAAITEVQAIVGDYFAPAQGGRFRSERVAAALACAEGAGATGVGQSSWGSSGFAFVRGDEAARRAVGLLRDKAAGLDIQARTALNRGASVTMRPGA
jgi:beta-ribofuranosylaminobenzene 5'-phosphate synthase